MKNKNSVPLSNKLFLSLNEAAAYSGIGINKLREITNQPTCNFVCFIGCKRMIKRIPFEEFCNKAEAI